MTWASLPRQGVRTGKDARVTGRNHSFVIWDHLRDLWCPSILTLWCSGAYCVTFMRNARHMVAVMVVATALCADRAAASQPSQRAGVGDAARQLANRISVNFRRVVPAVRIQFATRTAFTRPFEAPAVDAEQFVAYSWPLSPFQFRLPPPSVL